MNHRAIPLVIAALALPILLSAETSGQGIDKVPADVVVHFGDPVNLAGAANQVVVPDDVTIRKGGTVTFVVNGAGHGIAIYPVSKDTTRASPRSCALTIR
jgi:plastocyanin